MKKYKKIREKEDEEELELGIKPKKRFFCPASQRTKMIFETEAAAGRFIKFNGENIDPNLRAYYCNACCGWHLTHTKPRKNNDYLDFTQIYDPELKANKIAERREIVEKIKTLLPTILLMPKSERLRYYKRNNIPEVESSLLSCLANLREINTLENFITLEEQLYNNYIRTGNMTYKK